MWLIRAIWLVAYVSVPQMGCACGMLDVPHVPYVVDVADVA